MTTAWRRRRHRWAVRTGWRESDGRVLRDVGTYSLAVVAVAVSFGAISVASGIPSLLVIAMSLFVFAGSAQFAAVALLAVGNPAAAVAAGLLLNARHTAYGLALGPAVGHKVWHRLVGAHLMSDESFAFAMAWPADPRRQRAYWLSSAVLVVAWNGGTVLGVLLGDAIGDPAAFGLDAAFPAGMAALLLSAVHDRDVVLVALAGAAIAVVTTPVLPAGIPVLLSTVALFLLLPTYLLRRSRRKIANRKDHS